MNDLVKLITDDDGDPYEPVWHVSIVPDGAERILCSGEVIGLGEGEATFERKVVQRGGITCHDCLQFIREIKAIKL